ncbi:MAG: hypothetical protein PWP69_1637, partial [Enterococcus sp.]|uniref:hypothetical protein n=1 Tax=Enterococcus sp. TaxID=35783 RepID=UPI00258BC296
LLQKRSLNAIQFKKIVAYQAIWRTSTILSNAYAAFSIFSPSFFHELLYYTKKNPLKAMN